MPSHGNHPNIHSDVHLNMALTHLQRDGTPSYNHNVSVRSTTLMPLGEWSRTAATRWRPSSIPSQKDRATVDRGTDIYFSGCAGNEHALGVAPRQPVLVEYLPDFWANSCFLASLTLLRSLVLLYRYNKAPHHFQRHVTNRICHVH